MSEPAHYLVIYKYKEYSMEQMADQEFGDWRKYPTLKEAQEAYDRCLSDEDEDYYDVKIVRIIKEA